MMTHFARMALRIFAIAMDMVINEIARRMAF
jgi:hypothetical protein